MPCLIGTAGHVDHGKTSLIRALTGIDADRLPEEKARGVTIDVGYAFIDLPQSGRCSIVDVPGHQKYATNMLVGSMGIDVGLLCIAADEGVMPQTKEHLEILSLLPVKQIVVALTKTDLVDAETMALQLEEIQDDLTRTRFAGSPIIPVSAHSGEGLSFLVGALDQAVQRHAPPAEPNNLWYMPIDRSFVVKGLGLVVTGYMARGAVETYQDAEIVPGRLKVKIRSIQSHDETVATAERGMRVAMNITGVSLDDIPRGVVIGAPGAVAETMVSDMKLEWLDEPKHAMDVRVAIGTADAIGRLFLNDNDASLAQVRFKEVVAAAKGEPVIIRRHSPASLLGGGTVIVAEGEVRRKKDVVRYVDLANIEEGVLAAIHEDPNGVSTQEICRLIGLSQQQLGDHFERLIREKKIIGFAGIWYQPYIFLTQANLFLRTLKEMHDRSPMSLFQPRELVVQRIGRNWTGKPLERILAKLVELGKLEVDGTRVKLAEFNIALNPKQEAFISRIESEMDKSFINIPYPSEIASKIGVPVQAVEEMMSTAARAGRIVKIGDTLYYTQNQMAKIKTAVADFAKGKPFTASEVKEALQTSRKYIIPILEHLDAMGFTERIDDRRVVK